MYNPSKLLDLQRSALFFQLGHGGGMVVVAGLVAVVGSNDWSKWFETVRLIPVISVCVITTPVPLDMVLASSHQ